MSSALMGGDALERRPNPRGSRRPERNRRPMGIASVLAASLIIVGFLAVMGPRISGVGGHTTAISYPSATSDSHLPTVQPNSTVGVPITPVATPGSQANYVTDIVTAEGVTANFVPIDQTSHFTAGQRVDVIFNVIIIGSGQKHTVSIQWFYDGQHLNLTSGDSQVVDSDAIVYFGLNYPEAGLGMARIFFDLPSNDNGDQANDPYLAGQISFAIDPATTGAGTPAATRIASPTALLHRPVTTTLVALRGDIVA